MFVHTQCSYSVCMKSKAENDHAIEEIAHHWRSRANRTFVCYYDTETLDNVILEKKYSRNDVIHSMLWPSIVLVLCAGRLLSH